MKPETDGPGKLQGGDRDGPPGKDGVTMQLGIRLHDIKKAPLPERLQIAAKQGFACGHLALSKVISEYSVSDSALTPGLACYLKKIFAEAGIDIAVLGCYLNLATPNEESLKKNQERYLANIRFASLLGAGVVGTETGAVNEAYKFEERNHSEEALQIFVKNLRPVVEYAEKMGVIFAIEPVFKHIVCSPQRARRVLDEINSPNLQIIFDPVNLLDISNYQNREQIFREAVEMLGHCRSAYQRFYRERRRTRFRCGGHGRDGLFGDHPVYQKRETVYPCDAGKYGSRKRGSCRKIHPKAVG